MRIERRPCLEVYKSGLFEGADFRRREKSNKETGLVLVVLVRGGNN